MKFPAPFRSEPGPHPASYKMGTGSFLVVSDQGVALVTHPPPSAEVKEIVELYLYLPFDPSRSVLGRNLPVSQPTLPPRITANKVRNLITANNQQKESKNSFISEHLPPKLIQPINQFYFNIQMVKY